MLAKEAGLGLYLACWLFYAIFLLTSYFYTTDDDTNSSHDTSSSLTSWREMTYHNIFHVNGLVGGMEMIYVLYVAMGSAFLSLCLWIYLVFGSGHNPGIIDHREADFEELLQQSLYTLAPPSTKLYCHTTFVKKPLR